MELELARVRNWDREKERQFNSSLLVELVILELVGFQDGFEGSFGLISLSSLLVNSCQFFIVWKELARISSILEQTPLAKQDRVNENID